jgi:hypothetical protein
LAAAGSPPTAQPAPPQTATPPQVTITGAGVPVVASAQPNNGLPQNITINLVMPGGAPGQQGLAMGANDKRPTPMPQRLPPLPAGAEGELAAYQAPMKLPIDDPELSGEKKEPGKEGEIVDPTPAGGAPPTIGQAPEPPRPQFLRSQSILLDPGEYEFDITLQYSYDNSDFATAAIKGNLLLFGEANRRARLLTAPLEFRIGITPTCQGFVNVPFGWSDSEFAFAGDDVYTDAGGIGDVSAGIIRQLIEGDEHCPDVLATLAFSVPTGKSTLGTSLAVPGTALGEGFATTSIGLSFIQIYDPIVVFYGFGYRHRYENEFEGGFEVEPGKQVFYRYGIGFAVNPRVTLTAVFIGSYIAEDKVNGIRIGGTKREPMSIRLGATIARYTKKKDEECHDHEGPKNVEPFVAYGLTDESIDAVFGISWTY